MQVTVESGDVVVTGPDGLNTAMTPGAALRSARLLEEAAHKAAKQRGVGWALRSSR